jgi:hypothetical protein
MQYQKSYMIANHTSMADIMLMLAITGTLLFVGKRAFKNSFIWFSTKEPASWLTEVLQSRMEVLIGRKKNQSRLSICIFQKVVFLMMNRYF